MSLTDIIDQTFYEMHRLPAAALHKVCNWTKYTTSRIGSRLGYLTLATYVASTLNLTFSSAAESVDKLDKAVILGGALLLSVIYGTARLMLLVVLQIISGHMAGSVVVT